MTAVDKGREAENDERQRDAPRGSRHRSPRATVASVPVTAGFLGLAAASAVGIVLAYRVARDTNGSAHFYYFWLSYLLGVAAALVYGVRSAATRPDRILGLFVLGLLTFLPKFVMSVDHAVYFDEFAHWRQVNTVVATGNLMPANHLLTVVQHFPVLSSLTAAVHYATTLSTWHSGQLVILTAHVASLFLIMGLASAIGCSPTRSYLAGVIYALNPSFLYFDTQYAYESLALPLVLATLLFAMKIFTASTGRSARLRALGVFLFGVVTILTHHISAFVMLALALLIVAITPPSDESQLRARQRQSAWGAVLGVAAFLLCWMTVVASDTWSYLTPSLRSAIRQLGLRLHLTSDHPAAGGANPTPTTHALFSGSTAPGFEKLAGYLAPAIALFGVALVARWAWSHRADRKRVRVAVPMIILALTYFASLPFTLTAAGGEGAHRSWAYSYVGIATCIALGLPALRETRLVRDTGARVLLVVSLAAVCVLAVGNAAAGENVYYHFPGPYLFGSDTRSFTQESVGLAKWAQRNLPPAPV